MPNKSVVVLSVPHQLQGRSFRDYVEDSSYLTLVDVYDFLSCEDRMRVRSVVERKFRYYSKHMDLSVEGTNHNITRTKIPAVAAEGARMRDDLREVKSILDSIKLR